MSGRRRALIVGTERYDDPGFTQLAAPAHDAQALHDVLADPAVGEFEVIVLRNPTAQEARIAIETFFVEVKRDDLLLLHFSCHGVKSAEGELYLAMRDTRPDRLAATGLPADFVNRLMADSRAQQIALLLDCCFGGAFHRGMQPRAAGNVNVEDAFQSQAGVRAGRVRVVVTAAGDMQYALEGGRLVDRRDQPSVFTGVVVEALSSGKADHNHDGWVGIYELFDYVADHVAELTTAQTPELSSFGTHGDMQLAHSQVEPAELEEELRKLLGSTLTSSRLAGVAELRNRVLDADLGQAAAAWRELERRSDTDSSTTVRAAATAAMAAAGLHVAEGPVRLDAAGTAVVQIEGPPLARQVRAESDAVWLAVEVEAARLLLSVREGWAPGEGATVTVTGPTGSVRLEVLPAVEESSPLQPQPTPAPPPPPPPPIWRRRLVGVGVAAILIAAAGLAWFLLGDDGPEPLPQGSALDPDALVWTSGVENGFAHAYIGEAGHGELLPVDGWVKAPTLTDDRRTLLYLRQEGGVDTVWTAGSHGEDARRLIESDSTCPSAGRPAVNPDGDMIVLPCRADNGSGRNMNGLRVYGIDGNLVRILDPDHVVSAPTWTADGRSIVYVQELANGDSDDKPESNLAVVDAGHEDAVTVPLTQDQTVHDELPVVTPDGSTVVFVRRTSDGAPRVLYTMQVTGLGTPDMQVGPAEEMMTRTTNGHPIYGNQPTLAKDGDEVGYVKDRQGWKVPLQPSSEPSQLDGLSNLNEIAWARR